MERSGETVCSKTSRLDQNEDEEDSEEEEEYDNKEDDDSKVKNINGGSSSNNTIEENEKKDTYVRPYVRSKTPRLRWTNDLHLRFVQAVDRLGGQERATPKLVLEMMDIKELSIAHVKSHLQMYRNKKIDDPSQACHRYHSEESGDRNIYNLSQLPMLQGYNHRHLKSLRYGSDHASTIARGDKKWIHSSFMGMNYSVDRSRPKFYTSVGERIFGSNYRISSNPSLDEESSWRSHEPRHELFASSHTMKLNHNKTSQQSTSLKRKKPNCDLDLNLSLGRKSRNEEDEELCLSLYSSPSSSKVRKLIYNHSISNDNGDKLRENGRRASTLDLTI